MNISKKSSKQKNLNNKGFTLVELLAILIILAVIAVIVTPKITTIIEKSKKDSAAMSALGYIDAIEKYYIHKIKGNFNDDFELEGKYSINEGVLKKDGKEYEIELNGTKPTTGYVNIEEGNVISGCMNLGKYAVVVENADITKISKETCS